MIYYAYMCALNYTCIYMLYMSCVRVYYIGDKTSIESLKLGLVHYPAINSKQLNSPSQQNTTINNDNNNTNKNNIDTIVSTYKVTLTDVLGQLLCMSPTIQYLLQLEYIQKSGHNSDSSINSSTTDNPDNSAYNTKEPQHTQQQPQQQQQQQQQQEREYKLYMYHINNAIHKVKYALTNLHQAKQAVTGNGTGTGTGSKDYNSGIALITDALCKLKGLPTKETKDDKDVYSESVEYEYLPIHLKTQLLIER